MKSSWKASLLLLLFLPVGTKGKTKEEQEGGADFEKLLSSLSAQECHANGKVAAWCDSSLANVKCLILPDLDAYGCHCESDSTLCPDECIQSISDQESEISKSHHGILCYGIPQDEPNYILKNDAKALPSLHHCENNALVANWCNEVSNPHVNCLVLPSLDEYVCTCMGKSAACPSECVGGTAPDRRTHNAIRCRGIPEDSPNYILE